MEQNLLQLSNISYAYHTKQGEIPVLNNLSFSIRKGEFVSLVGPSGCGKTTILNILTGLLEPEEGSIIRKDNAISDHTYGYMLQQDQLFEWYTIWDNVTLGLKINHALTDENKAYVNSLLEKYQLLAFKDKHPCNLSGGMRQRAALIRTLATKPELLFLDEPFSALDYQNRLHAANDIGSIIKAEHKTALLVTHDIAEAISLSSRVIVLSKRPTHIKKEFVIPLYKSELTPLEIRNHPDFSNYFNMIWKELNDTSD